MLRVRDVLRVLRLLWPECVGLLLSAGLQLRDVRVLRAERRHVLLSAVRQRTPARPAPGTPVMRSKPTLSFDSGFVEPGE
jgi:hypothetical protein